MGGFVPIAAIVVALTTASPDSTAINSTDAQPSAATTAIVVGSRGSLFESAMSADPAPPLSLGSPTSSDVIDPRVPQPKEHLTPGAVVFLVIVLPAVVLWLFFSAIIH